jgi:hypothetical protein
MTAEHRNSEGVIDMYPDATATHLKRVYEVGATFRREWDCVREILQRELEVGNGPLGRQFMQNYRPAAIAVDHDACQVPGAYQDLANSGYHGVQLYEGADAEAVLDFKPDRH